MNVCVINGSQLTANILARFFVQEGNNVCTMTPSQILLSIREGGQFSHLNINNYLKPLEILNAMIPDLIINTDLVTGKIARAMVDEVYKKTGKRVLSIGATGMIEELSNPTQSLFFLQNSRVDTVPYWIVNDFQRLAEVILTFPQNQQQNITLDDGDKCMIIPNGAQSKKSPVDSLVNLENMLNFPLVVRHEIKQYVVKACWMFNGKQFIGYPSLYQDTEDGLFLHHCNESILQFTQSFVDQLTPSLSAMGFVGPLFFEIATDSLKIRKISAKPHPLFWSTFSKSFNQDFGKYLFSISKSVDFHPETYENCFGFYVNKSNNHYNPIANINKIDVDYYTPGTGDLVCNWCISGKIPTYEPVGYGFCMINYANEVNHFNYIAPFYNNLGGHIITFSAKDSLPIGLNQLLQGWNGVVAQPVLAPAELPPLEVNVDNFAPEQHQVLENALTFDWSNPSAPVALQDPNTNGWNKEDDYDFLTPEEDAKLMQQLAMATNQNGGE